MTITIHGLRFDTVGDAIQHWYAGGRGTVISVGNGYFVVEKSEAERIAAARVPFAYVFDHPMPDGTYRTVTVPVNDDRE
jgi:hypothetical protein